MALLLLAGVAYACVSHWMMLYHPAAPWALAVLLGPLWLTALGIAGSRFGSWGLALAGVAAACSCSRSCCAARRATRTGSTCSSTWASTFCCADGSAARCAAGGLSLIGQFAERVHPLSPAMLDLHLAGHARLDALFRFDGRGFGRGVCDLPFAAWSVLANLLTPV